MNRILTVAQSEFLSLIRTKAFIIGILLVPVLMVVFITFMNYAEDHVDTTDRRIAVIDETGGALGTAAAGGGGAQRRRRRGRRQDRAALPSGTRRPWRPSRRMILPSSCLRASKSKDLFGFVELPKDILDRA